MSSSWSAARIQAALDAALQLREAGNQAFRSGDYKLSTETYSEASYDVLHLKGLRHLGAIPANSWTFVQRITEMQFIACSNEAASWLKYEDYDGDVSRFRKALSCTLTAADALKDHPAAWKPRDAAMAKLLYRRALAYEGLEDYDAAFEAVEEAHRLATKDEAICRLATKISNIRQFGKYAVEDGFVPWHRSVESQLGLAA